MGSSMTLDMNEVTEVLEDAVANLRSLTPNDLNNLLIELITVVLRQQCRAKIESGATVEQVNVLLKDWTKEAEQWRADMLGRLMRQFNEPCAPTLALH